MIRIPGIPFATHHAWALANDHDMPVLFDDRGRWFLIDGSGTGFELGGTPDTIREVARRHLAEHFPGHTSFLVVEEVVVGS